MALLKIKFRSGLLITLNIGHEMAAFPVRSSELLGGSFVQSRDMGYSLFSGHRLHSAGVVHPFHTQPYFRHNIVDLVRAQLIAPDVIETEE